MEATGIIDCGNGISLRPHTADDCPVLTAQWSAHTSGNGLWGGHTPSAELIGRLLFSDPDYARELALGVWLKDELCGSIVAVHRPWKPGRSSTGFIQWIWVAPAYRRKGLGRTALTHVLTRLCARGALSAEYGGGAPCYLFPGVPSDETGLRGFLEAGGWTASSERISLIAELPLEETLPKLPSKVEISISRPSDAEETKQFIEQVFSTSWAIESEQALSGGPETLAVTARHDAKIIGFAVFGATNPRWLGPLGVDPAYRGKGIGKALVVYALREAAARGAAQVVVPWINDKLPFYQQLMPCARMDTAIKYRRPL